MPQTNTKIIAIPNESKIRKSNPQHCMLTFLGSYSLRLQLKKKIELIKYVCNL